MSYLALNVLSLIALLAPCFAYSQEVPMVNDDPVVNREMDPHMFEFISKILGAGKMAPHMQCTLKTRSTRELRKFSDGEEWIETLEIDFNSNGFDSGYKMKFKLPNNARYGVKKIATQWSGLAEDIKIDLGDRYGHYLRFAHDGKGQTVQLILGNDLRTTPCQVR